MTCTYALPSSTYWLSLLETWASFESFFMNLINICRVLYRMFSRIRQWYLIYLVQYIKVFLYFHVSVVCIMYVILGFKLDRLQEKPRVTCTDYFDDPPVDRHRV